MPALLGAEQIAGAAQLEVAHRDPESRAELGVLAQGVQALAGDVEQAGVAVEQQVGVGLVLEPAHPAAQLIELRKPEAVGALDDEGVAVRDIEPALDDRRADQHLVLAGDELRHDPLQPGGVHLAVADAEGDVRHQRPQARRATTSIVATRLCR